jgi:hypothetical protein
MQGRPQAVGPFLESIQKLLKIVIVAKPKGYKIRLSVSQVE